jgi:uncharacterized repeat protein (TIGR01451 family)
LLNKLLSNLPYNPSLINQVAFYSKRLRAESSIRRLGFVFVGLALIVQVFAAISPPQSTLAASSNDLINGGFNSAAEAASDCRQNISSPGNVGYQTILANYGITCDKVASAQTVTIHSTDFNRQLYSMGRLPYGIAGETPVTINGSTLYVRYLWGWDTGPPSTYQALNVTTAGGQTFFLLYNCGNLTSVGLPVPVQKPPVLTISKTTSPGFPLAGSTVAPGTILAWRVIFNNTGGTANNVVVNDPLPANTTFNWIGSGTSPTYAFNKSAQAARWLYPTLPGGTTNDYTDVKFQVNANTPDGTQICNVATISSDEISPITSNKVCMTVKKNTPPPVKTPPTIIPTPPATCAYDTAILKSNKLCVVCAYNNTTIQSAPLCKPCTESLSSQDAIACISVSKTAANLTENITNANNTTAQANDTILYTLYAKNSGKAAVKQFVFTENLSDVLDYASVVNLYGGTINQQGQVSWPAVTIKANTTASVKLTVKVDDPIPQTPSSSSDPEHFDHIMTNVYGNTININLPTPVVVASAEAVQTLPNTGPGSSLLIGGAITVVVGYFLARARLLAKETDIVRRDAVISGEV